MFRPFAAAILLTAVIATSALAETARDRCDQLAAAPFDDTKPADVPGVPYAFIDADAAVAACTEAVADNPDDGRLKYQLARATEKQGVRSVARATYLEAAGFGNALALRALGVMADEDADYAASFKWLERAVAEGSADAKMDLGFAYITGRGVTVDIARGKALFAEALADGKPDAYYWLGWLAESGLDGAADHKTAVALYLKGAEAGDPYAMQLVASAYEVGVDGLFDGSYPIAIEWLEKSAAAGNLDAMITLADAYDSGTLAPANVAKTLYWYEKAAGYGSERAMLNLGLLYLVGGEDEEVPVHLPRDIAKAEAWFEKAVAIGGALTMQSVATAYENSDFPEAAAKAAEWRKRLDEIPRP